MLGDKAPESSSDDEGSGGKWVVASLTSFGFGLIFLLAISIDRIGLSTNGTPDDFNSLSYDNVVKSLLGHLSREATTTSSVFPVLAELRGGGGEGLANKSPEQREGKGTESMNGTLQRTDSNGSPVGMDDIAAAPLSNGSQTGLVGLGSAPPFIGEWVPNPNPGPLYENSCPYISGQWTCPAFNVAERLRFWWKPSGSPIPFFDSKTFLSRMAGKTVGFYGDSLGRQQFQALVCTLSSRLTNGGGQDVTDVSAEWKRRKGRITAYYFTPSKITVFYRRTWSLCLEEHLPSKKIALHLDRADPIVKTMRLADVVVINTGHHINDYKMKQHDWVPYLNGREMEKISPEEVRATILRNIVKEMDAIMRQAKAERAAWRSNHRQLAAEDLLGREDTQHAHSSRHLREKRKKKPRVPIVYMRTLSPKHWTHGEWNTGGKCDEFRQDGKASPRQPANIPDLGHTGSDDPVMKDAVSGTSIRVLDITGLSVLRPDMHPASDRPQNGAKGGQEDCLHWCLPGVPDTWNAILFADFFDKKLQ